VNLLSSEERSGGRSFNKPVEEGKEYARVEGFIIFVPETKPGDHVKVRVTQVGPRFATAEVVK
jgi:predicted RNA-binding protein with TRAM domain